MPTVNWAIRPSLLKKLVSRLEKEKLALERKVKEASEKEKRYNDLLEEYKVLKQSIKESKQRMALEYKTQLQNELKNVNKRFEKTLADLKSSKKSQDDLAKEIRTKIKKDTERVETEIQELKEKVIYNKNQQQELKVGDAVLLLEGTEIGHIQEIDGKNAVVAFNHLRTKVKLKELKLSTEVVKKKATKGVNVGDFILEFKSNVDVRGMRAEEALAEVSKLIDQAVILSQSTLWVIHGRGRWNFEKTNF